MRILGPVEIMGSSGAKIDLQPQCRKVLALLVAAAGRPVSTGQLIRPIWGSGHPPHAPQMVRSHIRVLRGALRHGTARALTTSTAGYQIAPGSCVVDAYRFRELLHEARTRWPLDPVGAAGTARAALDLWRGAEAMPDVVDVQSLRAEAAYLEELRFQAEEMLVLSSLRSGQTDLALPRIRKLAELHPRRERFWLQLMVAEALSGRLVEATSITFRQARHHLVKETGLHAPGLERLQRELLRGVQSPEQLLDLITQSNRSVA
ncbi:AfsR/SARP family transcriptional regulator [Actinoplanes sp. CA-015351]|uniref:AfsR/SARP family transcriptional regulator n=1 Tax=Actinoplanes sp. CA-015351 TaxID=3239897 RepID=UPI003D9876ED